MRFLIFLSAALAFAAEPIVVDQHVSVAMRDGVRLYADVYRPARPGRYPVLVTRTPYGVQRDGSQAPSIRFAQEGYVVVFQDVRGRFESEGQWRPFQDEARDGHDTIQWAAAQSWSNGKVASLGGSYLGHNQWAAATQAPANLVTLFPAVASTNIYGNWAFLGGAFRLSFNYGWGAVRMPFRIMLPQYWHTESFAPEDWRYETVLKRLPLNQPGLAAHYREWLEHQSYDAYWKSISDEERIANVQVPAHTWGGWFDIFLAGTINGYNGMHAKAGTARARRESKMTIGPWGHGASRKYGDLDFGETAMRSLQDRELRWYNHYLKGEDNGIDREPPVEIFFMGANRWKQVEDWPPPGARPSPYYLDGGGKLGAAKPTGTPSDSYTYDPASPVPTLGGNNCCGTPTIAGPRDQREIERRPDVLGYTSAPLTAPLAIAGPVKVKLYAATDGRDTDFTAKLIDVYPGGEAYNIAEGILRARFRRGLDRMELLEPNRTYEFEIDLTGTANVFLPGHRIRLDISSSNFPQFDRNPNTGEALGASAKTRLARQTVFHSAASPSHVILPVLE